MDAPVQEGARGQHHGPGPEADAYLRDRAHHPVALHHQVIDRLLKQPQVGLVFQHASYRGLVQHPIGLGSGGTHGRPFGAVQDAKLDARFVSGQGHGPAEGIDFLDQMPFADAADAGVATHLPQRLDVVGQQQGTAAHAGAGQRRFGAGMAAADDDDIEFLGIKHGRIPNAPARGSKTRKPAPRAPVTA
jgi:hypothetical protein